jgi:hypothetical protein
MPVIVDEKTLATDELGLQTVGHVLTHLQRDRRLVVNLLLDGEQPDLTKMDLFRATPLPGHTIFIETADPRQMALDVLDDVASHLDEAESLKTGAIEFLQANQPARALEKLGACFSIWQHGQESILKTAQLLGIDLDRIEVGDRMLTQVLEEFTFQLRQIRTALQNRDFVLLADTLMYEATETTSHWRASITALRKAIG